MNLGLRTFLFGLAAQATCGAAIAQAASAPPAAEPQYTIKADEPRLGSYIRPDKFRGKSIALNLPYAQLPDKDRQALHAWWVRIEPGDEPPFPEKGLFSIYRHIGAVNQRMQQQGELLAVAWVNAQGMATEVKVLVAPAPELGEAAAKALLATKFKPAVCAGSPCSMEFPVHLMLNVRR